ncbi:hypothetical protein [Arenimonas sp.]|uniref:hypothetical protein n=1 Tax=Arenimonas sp. TaxID=1872635 RepID=UPI0025E094D7|nr:hypothetical protein [Arenimonas sp.]
MKHPKILLLALLPGVAAASQAPVGSFEDWTHGDTPILMMRSDEPAGRIDAEGNIHLALPEPAASRQTAARTFARCEGLSVSGGEVVVSPAMLFIDQGQGEIYLFPATSEGVAQWQATFGETPLVEGAWMQWIHASGEARIKGSCAAAIHTASSGDSPAFNERLDIDVRLSPGWNHVRQAIESVHVDPDGSRHVQHQTIRTVEAMPADIRWFTDRP